MVDASQRATHEQWLDLLSEVNYLTDKLSHDGERARTRSQRMAPAWDAYPASSLPESSIASGRVGNPVLATVIKHAGGKDSAPDDIGAPNKDDETTPDHWRDHYDPVGVAANRMHSEVFDACNRLATAIEASFTARGIDAFLSDVVAKDGDSWSQLLVKLKSATKLLINMGDGIRPFNPTPEMKAGRNRMVGQVEDARNRLRGATAAMNEALPTPIPDKGREVCASCGTARDVATDFGVHPYDWVVSEAKCRTCAKRIANNASKAS